MAQKTKYRGLMNVCGLIAHLNADGNNLILLLAALNVTGHIDDREKEKYVGLDCEMVGVGSTAKKSVLARCCLVDFEGEKIYGTRCIH